MHLNYTHSILKILERIFAIVVPIIFVMIERFFVKNLHIKYSMLMFDSISSSDFGSISLLVFYKKYKYLER